MRSTGPRVLFCWSGGGFPGLDLHAGMWAALEECGIRATANMGTSAGAIVAAINSAGHSAGFLNAILRGLTDSNVRKERAFWKLRLPYIDHFLSPNPIAELLKRHLPATFDGLTKPLSVFATDETTIRSVRINSGDLVSAVLASMSISGVFPRQVRYGTPLSDGGTTANLPVPTAEEARHWDQIWLLIAKQPVDYTRRGESVLSRLLWNVSMLMEDQVDDAVRHLRSIHPHVHVVRPAVGTRTSMLRFDHRLIEQAYQSTLLELGSFNLARGL